MKRLIFILLLLTGITYSQVNPFPIRTFWKDNGNYTYLKDSTKGVLIGATDTTNIQNGLWFKGWNGGLYLGVGSTTIPTYSFYGYPTSGMYYSVGNGVAISDANVLAAYFKGAYSILPKLAIGSGGVYGWVQSDGGNILSLANGTDTGNKWRVYADDSTGTGGDKYIETYANVDSSIIRVIGNHVGNTGGNLYIQSKPNKTVLINNIPNVPNTKKNLVWVSDSTIYVASKWDASSDIVIKFNKINFNLLPSFSKVYLIANTDKYINPDFYKATVTYTFLMADGQFYSDNIGPYKITGRTDFTGGNHGIEGTSTTLSADYNSPSTELSVTDALLFTRNGSYARVGGYYAKYTSADTANNKLLGVTWPSQTTPTTIASGTAIYLYHPTATNLQYDIYADGKTIPDSVIVEADELQVVVRNKVVDSNTFNIYDGTCATALYDNVYYRISEGNIEVMNETEFAKAMNITYYYGMQMLSSSDWMDSIYFAHGDTLIARPRGYAPKSGAQNVLYPSEKTIISNTAKTYCLAMWFDSTSSYYAGKATYLDAIDPLWSYEASAGKMYHNTIHTASAFTQGERHWWRGVYTFFPNNVDSATYNYKMKFKGNDYVVFDFNNAGTEQFSVPNFHSTTATESYKDATLTTDTEIKPLGLRSVSTGYGVGYYKLSK